MFVRMLKLAPDIRQRYDLSSLRMVVHAAAPCTIDFKLQMIDWWGPVIYEYYAGTENNGVGQHWVILVGWMRKAICIWWIAKPL